MKTPTVNKEKNYVVHLLIALFIVTALCSCSYGRVISGKISDINGNVVTVQGQRFKVATTDSLWLGRYVTFTSTVNRSKINSKKIN